jgi:hypothetical protein
MKMDRLLSNFQEGVSDDCWIWNGPKDSEGYGCLKIEGRIYKAHRLVYEYYFGEAPDISCHRCVSFGAKTNRKDCVNPFHIYNGTKRDNRLDQKAFGEDKQLKISDDEILKLRNEYRQQTFKFGEKKPYMVKVAKRYGVGLRYMQHILYGVER